MKPARRKFWGGRFTRPTAEAIERFTHSFSVDKRLARYDLQGSIAHARMLGGCRIIPQGISRRLVRGLRSLLSQCERGTLTLESSSEDVHTAIQWALRKKVGEAADYLHTARSRNDQVATDLRLFCKEKLLQMNQRILLLQKGILAKADLAQGLLMPGFTHLQHAQPVLVSHVLVSYLPMLQRDRQRLQEAFRRSDELPLGSGALTGTSLPIDRFRVARELGFSRVMGNSVDAVTDRDFVVEILSALSILGVHLSRIAEDLILWTTREFGFIRLDERLLTGSSMMPQKQNPDFLELTRAGSSRIAGNLSGLLTALKGLPTGYQRDLQVDKELLFEALDRIEGMLQVLTEGLAGIRWEKQALRKALAEDDSLSATDLAEYLVEKGVPFAQAHRAVGRLLRYASQRGVKLPMLALETFQRFSPAFSEDVYRCLGAELSVRRKRSFGSTHPMRVAQAIQRWKKRFQAPLLKT